MVLGLDFPGRGGGSDIAFLTERIVMAPLLFVFGTTSFNFTCLSFISTSLRLNVDGLDCQYVNDCAITMQPMLHTMRGTLAVSGWCWLEEEEEEEAEEQGVGVGNQEGTRNLLIQ